MATKKKKRVCGKQYENFNEEKKIEGHCILKKGHHSPHKDEHGRTWCDMYL